MAPQRRSRALCRAVAACQLITAAVAASDSVSISISSDSAPSDISQYVDLAFGGFGIEPSNLFSYTGQDSQNDLSVNLLQNLANYTGEFFSPPPPSFSSWSPVLNHIKLCPFSQENHRTSDWAATPKTT